jgi:hypothetical protein
MRTANSPAMEARRIRLQGERGIRRKTIAQGRPDAPADTCMLVCVFCALVAHETAGASQHPAFPAPSDFLGAENSSTTRAQRAARIRAHIHPSSLRTQGPITTGSSIFARWSLHRVSTTTAAAYGSLRSMLCEKSASSSCARIVFLLERFREQNVIARGWQAMRCRTPFYGVSS